VSTDIASPSDKCVFLAGASGVIGQALIPLLIADGWNIYGTTRSVDKADQLKQQGVKPIIVDVFDTERLHRIMADIQPNIVMHQLTDLPRNLDPTALDSARIRNARIRDEGTRNLIAAAVDAGAKRLIAQSIAFAYQPATLPYDETSPLDVNAPGTAGISARGVMSLEQQVLAAPLVGIVLRYGRLYGAGTGSEQPAGGGFLNVGGAARAAMLAMTAGTRGIYNIAEDDTTINCTKAKIELGW